MHYECEEMPYYINGKLYVPIQDDKGYDFKYAVYDKQGNKIQTTSLAEGEKVYQENRNGKYSIFSEEHRVTEQGNYSTVGLKDSIGKEVLSADYMLINGLASGTTNFSNGVVLVVLSEDIDEEEGYFKAVVEEIIYDQENAETDVEVEAFVRNVFDAFEEYINIGNRVSPEILVSLAEIENVDRFIDTIAANIFLKAEQKQEILEEFDISKRLELLYRILLEEIDILKIEKKITLRVKKQMNKVQK